MPAPHFQDGDNTVRLNLKAILQQRMSGPQHQIQQYLDSFEGYGPAHHSWMNGDQLKNYLVFVLQPNSRSLGNHLSTMIPLRGRECDERLLSLLS